MKGWLFSSAIRNKKTLEDTKSTIQKAIEEKRETVNNNIIEDKRPTVIVNITSTDFNNQICISKKIMAYMSAQNTHRYIISGNADFIINVAATPITLKNSVVDNVAVSHELEAEEEKFGAAIAYIMQRRNDSGQYDLSTFSNSFVPNNQLDLSLHKKMKELLHS